MKSRTPEKEKGNLYEAFAMRLSSEDEKTKSKNLKILREALALKLEDQTTMPGTYDDVSEDYGEAVKKLRQGGKIHCSGAFYGGYVSAVGQEFCLSEEDKVLFRESVCEEGDFVKAIKKGR